MKNKIISKFWDPDHTKQAIVGVDSNTQCYYVEFYNDDKLVETKMFPGKSLYYVEDAAENYTLGILNVT